MTELPNVTMIAVTSVNYGETIMAIKKSLEQIKPFETILFSDIEYYNEEFRWCKIKRLTSTMDYSKFLVKEGMDLYTFNTSHILVIQHDGYVLNGNAWTDEFLQYDYIGAPWMYKDGRNVGNGGFSLRSRRLHQILRTDPFIEITHPEDEIICRLYRDYLEKKHSIKFAPEELAHKFAYEMHSPKQHTFGFHNVTFNKPYREPVIVKRTGAMGDVIMMEPVLEKLYYDGYRVILDTNASYMGLFSNHFYPIEHISSVNNDELTNCRVINLDMAYEVKPKELVLKSYFEAAGIEKYELRNPRLNYNYKPELRMFNDYIVLHIDTTTIPHRDVHGVDWKEIVRWIEGNTKYKVFQIGRNNSQDAGLRVNTMNENMLAYFIAGASYFIGIDSGPSQIAVATGVKSVIFFGSVNPLLRYINHDNNLYLIKDCPIAKEFCYHSVIGVKGVDCEVKDASTPPCITWNTEEIIFELDNFLDS